jgi:hypothetical protein
MSWRILPRRTRIDILRGILLVGLAAAAGVYLTAVKPAADPMGDPLETSKIYQRNLQMIGGTANLVAGQITDGIRSLGSGKGLAGTLAVLTLGVAYGFYLVTEDQDA